MLKPHEEHLFHGMLASLGQRYGHNKSPTSNLRLSLHHLHRCLPLKSEICHIWLIFDYLNDFRSNHQVLDRHLFKCRHQIILIAWCRTRQCSMPDCFFDYWLFCILYMYGNHENGQNEPEWAKHFLAMF